MTTSALPAILTAFYSALNVAAFTALSTGGVFNHVPQGTVAPYTLIEDPTENRQDLMRNPGRNCTVRVHVVSTASSDLEALNILSKAIELLHYQKLAIAGFVRMAIQFENSSSYRELVNGVTTTHLVGVFRVQVLTA